MCDTIVDKEVNRSERIGKRLKVPRFVQWDYFEELIMNSCIIKAKLTLCVTNSKIRAQQKLFYAAPCHFTFSLFKGTF